MIYGDQCVMLEERHEAARYLRMMRAAAPERDVSQMEESGE